MRLWTLLKKDARVIFRSRLLLVVLLLYPLVIVAILGYAFSQPNQRVPLALVNLDVDAQGRAREGFVRDPIEESTTGLLVSSRQIIDELRPFADIREVANEEAGRRLLLSGEVQAVVLFPSGFVNDLVGLEGSGRLQITLDQSDPVRAKFMEILIRGVVQDFQERIVASKVDLVVDAINDSLHLALPADHALYPGFRGVRERLVDIRASHPDLTTDQRQRLNESIAFIDRIIPTLENSRSIMESVAEPVNVTLAQEKSGSLFIRDLVVPAAVGLSIFWTGTLATSSLVVYERESPAFTRLRVTPTTRASIYASKFVLAAVIILGQSLVILLAAILFWDTRVDDAGLTFLLVLLSTFASIGLGVFVSGIGRDVNGTILMSVLVTFPMLFLSGLFYPVTFMPKGAQLLANLFPLTYTVAGLRGTMLRGFDLGATQPYILGLASFGIVLTFAGVALGRRLERKG